MDVPAGLAAMIGPALDLSRVKKIAPTFPYQQRLIIFAAITISTLITRLTSGFDTVRQIATGTIADVASRLIGR